MNKNPNTGVEVWTMTAADTWGISGPLFLGVYAGLVALAAAAVSYQRRKLLGGPADQGGPTPQLGPYEAAMLAGGPALAITAAAVGLHRRGLLRSRPGRGALGVFGELDAGAGPLERAVFEAVRSDPGTTVGLLPSVLRGSTPLKSMTAELQRARLLVEKTAVTAMRCLVAGLGAALAVIGVTRVQAGEQAGKPVEFIAIMLAATIFAAAIMLVRGIPRVTARGEELVRDLRRTRGALRTHPSAADGALAVALFGGATLWLADPGAASTLGLRRDTGSGGWSSSGGDGGGGGGCGGSGCGGGGCGG